MLSPENPNPGIDPTLSGAAIPLELEADQIHAVEQVYENIAHIYQRYAPGKVGPTSADDIRFYLDQYATSELTRGITREQDKLPLAIIAFMFAGAFRDYKHAHGAADVAFSTGLFTPEDRWDMDHTINRVTEVRGGDRDNPWAVEDYLRARFADLLRQFGNNVSPQLELGLETYRVGAVMGNGTQSQTYMEKNVGPLLHKSRQR